MKEIPFLLQPCGKDYLWGGERLKTEYKKDLPLSPLAETWECSVHPDGPSTVAGGRWKGLTLAGVLKEHPGLLGTHPREGEGLPVLIKFIDAAKDLSVQVHPDDAYAFAHENGQRGKTEMWYVLDAAPGAKLIYGLRRDVTAEELRLALQNGTAGRYLQQVPVKKDDVFFIEPGTIHAIGAGVLLAEVQQSSNLTYRLYDYGRRDKNGRLRPLHLEKGLEVARLKKAGEPRQPMRVLRYTPGSARELLGRCRYFEVYRQLVDTGEGQNVTFRADSESFRVLLCTEGSGEIVWDGGSLPVEKGSCVFVPADSEELALRGRLCLLDVRG